ncbi:response regulator [Solimonas marina]|uniref:Response regulator n=1 Tax=Solimonas marina TaxID=2714601 RepID=A0A969W8P6_9GAMM|nr:response regulator [Solimonas marina]NKF21001.1 response regulator [Solimonas marina]
MSDTLLGKRVLVVEDEPLIGMLLEELLRIFGAQIVGPATHLDQALRMARFEGVDAAVLDINVDGELSYPVADVLRERGVPFVFATGYGRGTLSASYAETTLIEKPYRAEQLHAALEKILYPPLI